MRYGQSITVGTASAPHAFSGVCTRFNYGVTQQEYLDADEAGDHRVLAPDFLAADGSEPLAARPPRDRRDFQRNRGLRACHLNDP
jgi:hypothetical protein